MIKSDYEKVTSYEFVINCCRYSLRPTSTTECDIEETGNGNSDDCCQSGAIVLKSDGWHWDWGSESFDRYGNVSSADIIRFINDYPFEAEQ